MNQRTLSVVSMICLASMTGCASPDGGPSAFASAIRTRDEQVHAVREVFPRAHPGDPNQAEYDVDDLTNNGTSAGRAVALREQIIRRAETAYRLQATFAAGDSNSPSRRRCYTALVGPTPPLKNSALASATFCRGSLIVNVGAGWAYVSGDIPVTDTGVVKTSTLGSHAQGEWIGHVLPGGKQYAIYNTGKGPTSSLAITIRGTVQSRRLEPGEVFEFDAATNMSKWSRYDPNLPFLQEVVKIAAQAGVTVRP